MFSALPDLTVLFLGSNPGELSTTAILFPLGFYTELQAAKCTVQPRHVNDQLICVCLSTAWRNLGSVKHTTTSATRVHGVVQ